MIAIDLAKIDTNIVITIATIVGALVTAVLGHFFGTAASRAEHRRAKYAEMVRTLVQLAEMPYRIRRRTSDGAPTLQHLAEHMHDVQERVQGDVANLRSEAGWLVQCYQEAVEAIRAATRDSITDAWNLPPITTAAGMVLNGWGPGSLQSDIDEFSRHLKWRFGWRRALNLPRRTGRWAWQKIRGKRHVYAPTARAKVTLVTARTAASTPTPTPCGTHARTFFSPTGPAQPHDSERHSDDSGSTS